MARVRGLAEDTAHELLADARRLRLLSVLKEEGKTDVDDLARRIAAREGDVRAADVEESAYRRVKISLVHQHLPLLADHDVIQYKADSGEVVLLDVVDDLDRYTERIDEPSILRKLIPS